MAWQHVGLATCWPGSPNHCLKFLVFNLTFHFATVFHLHVNVCRVFHLHGILLRNSVWGPLGDLLGSGPKGPIKGPIKEALKRL
jgi:hypothetical protein